MTIFRQINIPDDAEAWAGTILSFFASLARLGGITIREQQKTLKHLSRMSLFIYG